MEIVKQILGDLHANSQRFFVLNTFIILYLSLNLLLILFYFYVFVQPGLYLNTFYFLTFIYQYTIVVCPYGVGRKSHYFRALS